MPSLRCVLTHFYELRAPGERIGSVNNKRLASITSMHKVARRQGLDAVRGHIMSSVKGERVMEPALLPIGAALFNDEMPVSVLLRHMRGDSSEFRAAAIFAGVYHPSSDLSMEFAEALILGTGDRLVLQAIKEVLDLRSRTGVPEGSCGRCGEKGTRLQEPMNWLPNRTR